MSENTQPESGPGSKHQRLAVAEMLAASFERLPDSDKHFFHYGPLYLGGNASLAGLVANSLYRRALNVRQAQISSSLPTAVLPFMTTVALYNAAVSSPLMFGDLNCPSCALIRGALVGVVSAGLYPILLALPINLGLAARYSTAPIPEKGTVMRFSMDLSRPVLRKMRAVLVLQAFFGMYLGSQHFKMYTKLAQITFGSAGDELEN